MVNDMNVTFVGLPAYAIVLGYILFLSIPVWLAAKFVGARSATIPRAMLSLFLGAIFALVGGAVFSSVAFIMLPLGFLISFKYVLDTSFFGAFVLGVLAVAGYFALVQIVGSDVFFTPQPISA